MNDRDNYHKRIVQSIVSNTIVLGLDYVATSMPFGMALKAEALVRKPQWNDLLQWREWKDAYKRAWNVLKYGFYPSFLLGVATSEATKQLDSPIMARYGDFIMPGIINMATAPASSLVSINTRYHLQLDLIRLYRQRGMSGVSALTGGVCCIGLREALCFHALHHNSNVLAKRIADGGAAYRTTAFVFRKQDGNPTIFSKLLASFPDGLAMLAAQPLTIFAANAAVCKYRIQQDVSLMMAKPKLTSPISLLRWQWKFGQFVCQSIVEEGKKSGLSFFKSFAPGVVVRTSSLLGTLTVFKYALEPVTEGVRRLRM